jgi:hypothetical protein
MSGRIAQFGKGAVTQVSNHIIKQFVERLDTEMTGDGKTTDTPRISALASEAGPPGYLQTERATLALTALAGVALGLAIARLANRLSCPPRRT